MNTKQIELTQQQADAIERAYPMHGSDLQALITKAEQTHGVTAEEKAAILEAVVLLSMGNIGPAA